MIDVRSGIKVLNKQAASRMLDADDADAVFGGALARYIACRTTADIAVGAVK